MKASAVSPARAPSVILALWATWLFAALLMALLSPMLTAFGGFQDLMVILHMTTSILIIGAAYPQKIALLLAASLTIRTALVYWDLHFRHIWEIINSGGDTEMFYELAVLVSEDPSLLSADLRGGTFSKMFGVLFYFIGPTRLFAQYTTALLGLTLVLIVYAILRETQMDDRTTLRVTAIAALFPNSLMLSAIFLRESIVAALVAASLLHFVRWFYRGALWRVVVAVLFVLAASAFHSGVIAVGVGYMFVTLFYNRQQNHFKFGFQSLPYFAAFAAVLAVTVLQYPDLFLGKFEQFDETAVVQATNYRYGGSTYLTGLVVDDYADLILYGPLRALYFLGAPMPWDFRGLFDVLTFAFDSALYLAVVFVITRNFQRLTDNKQLTVALLVVTVLATFVFGAGVSNAGTALRHRYKLFALFLTLAAFATTSPNHIASSKGIVASNRLPDSGQQHPQLPRGAGPRFTARRHPRD